MPSALEIFRERIEPRIVVTETGCWEIPVCDNGKGYKYIRVRPRRFAVHRLAFTAFIGRIGKLNVLHRCDNRGCCNPEHLFKGTQADNIHDMDAKGRRGIWRPTGKKNPAKRAAVRAVLSRNARSRKRLNGRFAA